jgi:TRAP-type C4-dicarboxylate transport system permease small subunit
MTTVPPDATTPTPPEKTGQLSRLTKHLTGAAADRGAIPVWAGFIGAPLVWGIHLQIGFMLVPWICTTQRYWVAHLFTIVCVTLSLGFTWLCWREWRHVGGGAPSGDEAPALGRTRFVAVVGLMSAALFTFVTAAGHLPIFFFSPCSD